MAPQKPSGFQGVDAELEAILKPLQKVSEYELPGRAAIWLPLKWYFYIVARRFRNQYDDENTNKIKERRNKIVIINRNKKTKLELY